MCINVDYTFMHGTLLPGSNELTCTKNGTQKNDKTWHLVMNLHLLSNQLHYANGFGGNKANVTEPLILLLYSNLASCRSLYGLLCLLKVTPLIHFNGRLNQHKYISILNEYFLVCKYASWWDNWFYFRTRWLWNTQGEGSAHICKSKTDQLAPVARTKPRYKSYRERLGYAETKSMLKNKHPTSRDRLFEWLFEVWNSIPTSYFETFVSSITCRIKGLSTKY